MNHFEGKTILITGGTSGIGLAGAKLLVAENARVIVTGRSREHLANAASALGNRARVEFDDACDEGSPDHLRQIVREEGGIDGLWLNAGYASRAAVGELSREESESMFAVNTIAPMLQLGVLSTHIRNGGSIVVTSSTAAYEGGAGLSLYSATKAALIGAARCWATEFSSRGIRVNTLVPGPITSNLRSFLPQEESDAFEHELASRVLTRRVGDASEAASLALFLLSDAASYITGSSHQVDGGLLLR